MYVRLYVERDVQVGSLACEGNLCVNKNEKERFESESFIPGNDEEEKIIERVSFSFAFFVVQTSFCCSFWGKNVFCFVRK